MKRKDLLPLLLLFILGCSSVPPNLKTVKIEIEEYYDSGRYRQELKEVISGAIEEFSVISLKESSAVVFDIDETALSNYKIMKEIDFGYHDSLWDNWILKAEAPAIAEVKVLYDTLSAKGIKIIFITGRKDSEYEASVINLKKEGYTEFDTLITRKPTELKLKAADYKSRKRTELAAKGYDIIGSVGDQWSDLEGPFSGIRVKIPNYLYYIP